MMNKAHTVAPAYALPEESFQTLEELWSLLCMMIVTIDAATAEEEAVSLEIPRSTLANCLDFFASKLADVLNATKRSGRVEVNRQRMH
jgi:hypothetical protein